jgi:glutaredoxin
MDKIILYSTNCPKCKVICKKLQQKELEFTEIDCKTDTTYIEMLSGKGFRGMPVLQVGDEYFDFIKANKWIGEQ